MLQQGGGLQYKAECGFKSTQSEYQRIFHPERVAIIGVSSKGAGFGSGIFHALRAIGYKGEIFLVNPKGGELAGEPIYKSVAEIPGSIDLAIIAVAAKSVPEILEACRRKGAAGAEILSSGFKELGTEEGAALEEAVVRVADKGIRVIGPNCFGIYCPESGLTVLPGPDLSRIPGAVGFSSQSGGMAVDFANQGKSTGLTFSKVVSFGNGADLRETELLHYFGSDPQTRIIALYVEGVEDGPSFFEALRMTGRVKPVIVMKGGLSDAGSRAVRSHTASMGGSRRIWTALLRQANAVKVMDPSEMAQACLAFSYLPKRVYQSISVLGGGGALGVAAADAAEAFGIHIPRLPESLSERIDALLPRPGSSPLNPIDVANPYVAPAVLKEVLAIAAEDERIELQVVITLFHHYKNLARATGRPVKEVVPFEELADGACQVMERTAKPVVIILNNPKRGLDHIDVVEMIEAARSSFLSRGIACFDDLNEALRAIAHQNDYYRGRRHG
jgi:acyl-CoA synthetase (NDP forming)